MNQKIGMHVRMNQLVQDGHPLRPRRPLQTLRAQEEGLLLGHIHITSPCGLSGHGTLLLFYCGVSGGHCIDVFV